MPLITDSEMIEIIKDYFRQLHDDGLSWPEIERQERINRSTAYGIANDPNYFPKDKTILATLGIPPKHKPFESYKDLFSIPASDLKWMIENRNEEF